MSLTRRPQAEGSRTRALTNDQRVTRDSRMRLTSSEPASTLSARVNFRAFTKGIASVWLIADNRRGRRYTADGDSRARAACGLIRRR